MTMPAAIPKYLRHKPSGRVYPYSDQLAKLGSEVEPFDMPAKPAAPKAPTPPAAAKPAPAPVVEPVEEAKPDKMAAARAARAAKAAQRKAAVGQQDEPVEEPVAPAKVNAADVEAMLGRVTDSFEEAEGA